MATDDGWFAYESGIVLDWIYDTVVAGHDTVDLLGVLKAALDVALSNDFPEISDAELDAAIKAYIEEGDSSLDDLFNQGLLTKDQYDRQILRNRNRNQNIDRDSYRESFLEARKAVALEDGFAACEVLAAIMGLPTSAFEKYQDMTDEEFGNRYRNSLGRHDKSKLLALIPSALSVAEKLVTPDSMKLIGWYDARDRKNWRRSVGETKNNLLKAAS